MKNIYEIFLGDCLDVMKEIPDKTIDFILTDLPYGNTACAWDIIIPFDSLWKEYKRIIKPNSCIALFGTEPFSSFLRLSNLEWYKYDWLWIKPRGSGYLNAKNKPLKNYENVSIFSNGTTANGSNNKMRYFPIMRVGKPYTKHHKNDPRNGYVDAGNRTPFKGITSVNSGTRYPVSTLEYSNNNHGSLHPTQKPVDLLEYLIKTYTLEKDVVLDSTMGSGSTIIACQNTNRKGIGIEKDENYYNIAKQRIEENQIKI